uniref:RxLR effector protein n=1 Tax=Phytophthora sojae TaxID=67593 RepID=G1FSQ7_PHYSO|nr:Avh309 [Phytophthora sojae]
MQFGFFLLVVIAALATSCEAALDSTNAAITLSSKASTDIDTNAVGAVFVYAARFLRAGDTSNADAAEHYDEPIDQERANAWYDKVASFVTNLNKGKAASTEKKAAADLTRTFRSPPTADKVTRSKSFSYQKATTQKLTRFESLPNVNAFTDKDVLRKAEGHINNDFKKFDRLEKTPDDIIKRYDLDTSVLTSAKSREQLRGAA